MNTITTEEFSKNVNELRNYKTNMRQMVQDNMLREIHTREDTAFIAEIDRIVGSQVNYATAEAAAPGANQNIDMGAATINRSTLKRASSYMVERQLPHGVNLLNVRTGNEVIEMGRDEIGGDLAQKFFTDGLGTLDEFRIMNQSFISTIKNSLVANGTIYQFAPKEFLGNACMLEDIRVTIEKKRDIIRMFAQEQVGLTIGNTKGVQKLQFSMIGVV